MHKVHLHIKNWRKQAAFSLVELILALSILSLLVAGLSGSVFYSMQATGSSGFRQKAAFLAAEAIEATRNIRDNNFSTLADGTYGLSLVGNRWQLTGSQDVTDIFTRQVQVSTVDSDTKRISVTVNWTQGLHPSNTISFVEYLTNWQRVVSIGPSIVRTSGLDITGTTDGVRVAVSGNFAYLITTSTLYAIDISNSAAPVLTGSISLGGGALADIAVSGNFAYIASSQNNPELHIVNISNPATPTSAGSYNAAGNADALGVAVSGTTVYLTRVNSADPEFLIINATNPASPTLAGSLNLTGNATSVAVNGTFAYLSTTNTAQEMSVVSIAAPATPTLSGGYNATAATTCGAVAVFGTRALLGCANNTLYSLSISTPATPTLQHTYTTGSATNDIVIGNTDTRAYLGTSNTTTEVQILDISSTTATTSSLTFNAPADVNGVFYLQTPGLLFTASTNDTEEFTIYTIN